MKHYNDLDHYLTQSLMSGWEFLTGDMNFVEYGGSWVKQLSDVRYLVIELINLKDAMGDKAEMVYDVGLKECDIESPQLNNAIASHGFPDGFDVESHPLAKVEVLVSFGNFAPMGEWSGNNYRELLRQAKSEARRLIADHHYHAQQMNRPVNKLGSTAYEYAQGDFDSAMIRGIARDDKAARIFGKMRGLKHEDMNALGEDEKNFSLTGNWEEQ